MLVKYLIISVSLLFPFAQSNGQTTNGSPKTKFVLNGHVQNRDTGIIVLQYINNEKWIRDTTVLHNGQFQFEGYIKEPVMAGLIGNWKIINHETVNFTNLYIEPTLQKIQLVENDYAHFKMEGSKTQKEFDTLQMQIDLIRGKYKETEQELNVTNDTYTSAKNQGEKDIIKQRLDELIEKLTPRYKEINSSYILFALNHPDSYVSASFLFTPIKTIPIDSAKSIFYKLTPRVQNSAHGKIIAKYFDQIDKNAIGKSPFNFSVTDITGSNVSLNKFKDKYIYIDFWASWCIPCREAIPHLKLLFDKYYDKGLEVITISIDRDSKKWKEAVVEENLTKWHNLLVTKEIEDNYDNVQNAIPSGILISKEGKIIWKSSSEEKLEDAIKRFIK